MISIFSIVLLIHVLSSMMLFATFALEGNVLLRTRSARSEQLHACLVSFEQLRWIAIPSFLGLLGAADTSPSGPVAIGCGF